MNLTAVQNEIDNPRRDLLDAKLAFSNELAMIVMPLLNRLKELISDVEQSSRLIDLIESNLQHLVRTYQKPSPLTAAYRQLSPIETLVASMIRQGISTKNISEILKLSVGTLNNHRKSIRKKLGFANKPTNLADYLTSLPD